MSKRVITINRMLGSNGRLIGRALADELGFAFYDRELIDIAAKKENIPHDLLEKVDEKRGSQWRFPIDHELQLDSEFHFVPMNDVLFDLQRKIILEAAQKEDCVIVGRCANHILQDNCLSVFIYAPYDYRVQTVIERTGREEKSVQKLVKKVDKERRTYYEYFTDRKWTDLSQYHLSIDSSKFDQDTIVKMIKLGCKCRLMTFSFHNKIKQAGGTSLAEILSACFSCLSLFFCFLR